VRRLWYKWKLHWATHKARKAKAHWLATKESVKAHEPSRHYNSCPHKITEGEYCEAIVFQRMYEKLLNPDQDIPKATAKKKVG
jgi:hypothetical protein